MNGDHGCRIGETIIDLGRAEHMLEAGLGDHTTNGSNGQDKSLLLKLLVCPDVVILQSSQLADFSVHLFIP